MLLNNNLKHDGETEARARSLLLPLKAQIVPATITLRPGRLQVNKKRARKPFVAPQLKEEASLADVTLVSPGGQPTFRRSSHRFNGFRRGGHKPHGHGS